MTSYKAVYLVQLCIWVRLLVSSSSTVVIVLVVVVVVIVVVVYFNLAVLQPNSICI